MMRSTVITICLALALAGCGGEEKKAVGGTASGEVLPGSVSDAMLPLDTVKSQAPLAPKVEGGDKGSAKPAKDNAKSPAAAKDNAEVPAAVAVADEPSDTQ